MTCREKRGYPTKKKAKRAALRSQARGGVTLRIYLCRYCTEWHLTHRTREEFETIVRKAEKLRAKKIGKS